MLLGGYMIHGEKVVVFLFFSVSCLLVRKEWRIEFG